MIWRQCTTLPAAANNRLLICPPTIRLTKAAPGERTGNLREVRPATLPQVLVAAWSEKSGGWVVQHHGAQFPAETRGFSEIAADAAAEQFTRRRYEQDAPR